VHSLSRHSNVIRPDNFGDIKIKNWHEIGNHTVSAELIPKLVGLGIHFTPGELANASC